MQSMDTTPQWIVLAQILRPQGRRGEVLADLFTDFPERFDEHPRVWLAPAGFSEAVLIASGSDRKVDPGPQQSEIAAHWLPTGRNAGRIVLHFAGIDSIEQAENLSGKEVVIPANERLPLDDGAAYISDLIGSTVYDGDIPLGVVESVQFPASPDGTRKLEEAAPILSVTTPDGDEVLVPFAKAFLVSLDLPARAINMTLPEGLADINRPQDASLKTGKQTRSKAADTPGVA
jgi:16S rRNA processing protein RimM